MEAATLKDYQQPDPDGYDVPASYADNQHDDTLDQPREQSLGGAMIGALNSLGRLVGHAAHGKCESPIEQIFLRRVLERWPEIDIEAQVKIGPYRADFVLEGKLVVECDGREFHESLTQQAHDSERDDLMRELGYIVIRLSGADIHRGDHCLAAVGDSLGLALCRTSDTRAASDAGDRQGGTALNCPAWVHSDLECTCPTLREDQSHILAHTGLGAWADHSADVVCWKRKSRG